MPSPDLIVDEQKGLQRKSGSYTFSDHARRVELESISSMDKRVQHSRHETIEHLRLLVIFKTVYPVGLHIEHIILNRLRHPILERLLREELDVGLVVPAGPPHM